VGRRLPKVAARAIAGGDRPGVEKGASEKGRS